MKYALRPYQSQAVSKLLWSKKLRGADLCILPTGAGKSIVIADLARQMNQPVLILQPTREILEQNYEKLSHWVDEDEIGVYSASMNRKDFGFYTFATIQSIYKKPKLFKHFEVVIIDECFIAGTLIDGKPIEEIKVFDLINSYNHKTEKIEKKEVVSISKKPIPKILYCINLLDESIISTSNHPYYVEGKGYVEAKEIERGDILYAMKNKSNIKNSSRSGRKFSFFPKGIGQEKRLEIEKIRVESVEVLEQGSSKRTGKSSRYDYVYNLQVKDNNNYFANSVLVHNCHLVNSKNLNGMYTQFFKDIGDPKIFGFTATPYRLDQSYERLDSGTILTHTTTKLINRTKGRFWHRIMFNINNEELIKEGYLLPLKYLDKTILEHENIPTNISKSDFELTAYEKKISKYDDEILEAIYLGKELANSVLVFCSSVQQASNFSELVTNSAVVTSKTNKKNRANIIRKFRSREIQVVFNVGVLTIGFDHPELGCIVLLRPTRSIGLYYQMLGRGVRIAPGKKHCWVIDMTGTVKQLGKIETIKMVKRKKWELESEKGSWHNKILYSFLLKNRD